MFGNNHNFCIFVAHNDIRIKQMHRHLLILIISLLLPALVFADDNLPIVEIKADRTIIYPQRMELSGEETLMDILQMVPDLLIGSYDDVIDNYNLRIDNVPMNGDNRLILSQMKAKDIDKIQVCDNTGVAKGTIGIGNVLDINMKMPEGITSFVEGQGGFGKDTEGNATVNMLYGSKSTDIYANATYRHQMGDKEYVTLHMTNRFDDRNKLLTYFTQQYVKKPYDRTRRILGRARYFHTFNDIGTELLLLGGYQYASDPFVCNKLPMYTVELNTPLFTKQLSMMLGSEGDYLITNQKFRDWSWNIFNTDIYLQFTYTLPKWRFTAGHRVMFYGYKLMNEGVGKKFNDTRNNSNVCAIYVPNSRHQIQLGYYHKYYNPAYEALFMNTVSLSYDEWLYIEENLEEWIINQIKLAYIYTKSKFTLQTEASYYFVENDPNAAELDASVYWKTKELTLTGGLHALLAKDRSYAALRLAPTVYLPHSWKIGLQLVYFTELAPKRQAYGTPVYACLSVNKQFGKHWNIGIDWHDMFDAFSDDALSNRNAANVKVQYRF